MLDGASRIKELVKAAKMDSQPALGITDHGNMYGVLDFYKACRLEGINPIIGLEAYMAAESRFERPQRRGRMDDMGGEGDGGEKLYYHLTLLAESTQGYMNLMKLSSYAYLEGYYYKPRLDFELLERYHEGIIASSGCLGGLILQSLLRGDLGGAQRIGGRLQDIFGKESFFIELQDHGIPEQRRTNPMLVELASHLDAPLLATNDSHYTMRNDAVTHDALLCVQTGATLPDEKRFRFHGHEYYLKSAAEMRDLFKEVPQACDSTLEIAERSNIEIEFGRPKLPEFEVPVEFRGGTYEASAARYLRHLTYQGAAKRYGDLIPDQVRERLDFELSVISSMGFSAYFLVVGDLIQYARDQGIRVGPGRGSAAGCCVAYCLGIVNLDPIRYDLLFERFLNPGRQQMPDIDMDFDERYRAEMIRYVSDKYGWDHVAQIITFSTIKARAAVRDAARVLAKPYQLGDRIAKAMPPLVMGRDTPLAACLEVIEGYEDGYKMANELREMVANDSEVREVVEVAKGLEGLRRQDGIHAAAVVITHEPLMDYLPIQRKPDPNSPPEAVPIVTQYEMHGVEELGLLKMDFLGLRTLSVIERALDVIEANTGSRPDIDEVALDDEKTFEMLRAADSLGVFQLEGGPMRSLMRSLAPTHFGDVAALVALYRPGPMAANMHNDYADRKNGRKQIVYLHPDLEDLLADTYGLMIYQESVMRVAQRFAGYSLEEADNLRKACGKKIRVLIQAEREKFIAGCLSTGYDQGLATALFDIIEPFADYAFNKSHSYGYGLVAYQTAWLKANYPVEYLTAMLTSAKDDKDKTAIYLTDCRNHGIEVLVPDVNVSLSDFTVTRANDGRPGISFGLAAIRNVGEALVDLIIKERERGGKFVSFVNFCSRVDLVVLNKRAVESLIKAGAFDSLGDSRKGLLDVFEAIIARATQKRREMAQGIQSLFDAVGGGDDAEASLDFEFEISEEELPQSILLAYEKEMLGLYVSNHPLRGYEADLGLLAGKSISELREGAAGQRGEESCTIVGIVTSVSRRYTRRGELMASFVLEDLESSVEVFVFPRTMTEYGHMVAEDGVFAVKGRPDYRDDQPKFIAASIERLDLSKIASSRPLRVQMSSEMASGTNLVRLRAILDEHPGDSSVFLEVDGRVFSLPDEVSIDVFGPVVASLREAFGPQILGTPAPGTTTGHLNSTYAISQSLGTDLRLE